MPCLIRCFTTLPEYLKKIKYAFLRKEVEKTKQTIPQEDKRGRKSSKASDTKHKNQNQKNDVPFVVNICLNTSANFI